MKPSNRPSPAQQGGTSGPSGTRQASGEAQTPATDMQAEDVGSPASGAANRGSPAAPVMKQFAKTKAESSGRP